MASMRIINTGKVVKTSAAVSILNTLMREGVAVKHVCGGKAQCGTCRFRIIEGERYLSPITERERARLEALGNMEKVRLACQTFAFGDITIEILLTD
ncbi:MAG: (2Fe-2S)-binding protein [Spirochaetales bacterium]|nr:(2Fe-2S)-binding protein [Spirochaetales bacterium]